MAIPFMANGGALAQDRKISFNPEPVNLQHFNLSFQRFTTFNSHAYTIFALSFGRFTSHLA